LLITPTVMLTESAIENSQHIAQQLRDGTLNIPSPPESVQTWPLVGKKLYSTWDLAATNLGAVVSKYKEQLTGVGKGLLSAAAGAGMTVLQFVISIIIAGVLSMIAFHLLLHHTTFGKALRAISDNRELAGACAIDSEKMIKWMWFSASAYGVLGGCMIAMEHLLYPRLGFNIIIPVFCAAILGGIGNPYGAMIGALILAFAENIVLAIDFSALINLGGLFDIGSLYVNTGYKPAISFVILIVILLFKPTGILGKN